MAIGYSTDFTENKDYVEQGLFCEWEHCIENMPMLPSRPDPWSCPVFGHCCPGGAVKVRACGKTIDDVPAYRFAPPEHIEAWLKEIGYE